MNILTMNVASAAIELFANAFDHDHAANGTGQSHEPARIAHPIDREQTSERSDCCDADERGNRIWPDGDAPDDLRERLDALTDRLENRF